jgi:hypothetical protein
MNDPGAPLNEIIDRAVREWLDRHFATAYATVSEGGPEKRALEQARHLHLDNYWYDLTPKILDALMRAGHPEQRS